MSITINKSIDRRTFVGAAAAAMATLGASGSLYGCDNRVEEVGEGVSVGSAVVNAEGAEWKTVCCLHGCGQRCMNQALVKEGVVLRQKTDDTHEDSILYPQQRGCLRGRSVMEFEKGEDRIKYPMKRISWSPEDPHGELRGKEGYDRISWDEALQYAADQLKRAYQSHGPKSVYVPTSLSGSRYCYAPLLNACGGYLTVSDTVSYGTYTGNTDQFGLAWGAECMVNDRLDMIANADTVVLYGQNPGWGANGNPSYNFCAAHERGAQFICVGPDRNVSAAMLDAHWIPVLPGKDTAFLIGVAGEMLKLDGGTGSVIDWDFLHTYCVGFDEQSMPADAATTETYRGYLEGAYDGTVKDAAWASAICGTPEDEITWFAQQLTRDKNVFISHGYSGARCNGAEDLPQALFTLALMGGHLGKPGNACGNLYVDRQGPGGVQIIETGTDPMDDFEADVAPLYDTAEFEAPAAEDLVNALDIWNAIIDGQYHSVSDCWDSDFTQNGLVDADIHVVWAPRDGSARSIPNASQMPEAMRKVDFVLAQGFATCASTMYADIILPSTAMVERNEIPKNNDRDREMILVYSKVGGELYEAKSDQWIQEQILQRLGYDPAEVFPYSEDQRFFTKLATCAINGADGSSTPLVSITREQIEARGVEGEPQQGAVDIDELLEKGVYQVPRTEDDGYVHIAYREFIDDPEGSPLDTASGKFEIYCQAKADMLNRASMDGGTYKPYPTYHEFAGDDGYPLLMFTPHYPRTACSDFGNVKSLRDAWTAPVTLSAQDAASLGVETGDAVLVSSPYGKIARECSVSQLLMPGTVSVPNGSWPRFGDDGVDYGGCPNTLYGGKAHGMGVSGYNNVSVKVEKWTGGELQPDADTQVLISVEE